MLKSEILSEIQVTDFGVTVGNQSYYETQTPNLELSLINLKIQSLRGAGFCEPIDYGDLQDVRAGGQAG